MATGIQTGMRRGSRPGTLGSAPTTSPTILGHCKARWAALTARSKAIIIGSVLTLQVVGVGLAWYAHSTRYVDLYPTKMVSGDIPEVSRALLEMGIDHQVASTNDGIVVPPHRRLAAQAGLTSRHLPLHAVFTQGDSNLSRTAAERKAIEQRVLEGEITLALREVEGVNDARVKLAVPERTHFGTAQEPNTASVSLTLERGRELTGESLVSIRNMVAYSVPGLNPDNVKLTDTRGRNLSAKILPENLDTSGASGVQFEIQTAEEQRLQEKVQSTLDEIFPDKTKVLVHLNLDFSTVERRVYTPGDEQDAGMVKDSFQLLTEMFNGAPKDKPTEKDYQTRKESVNFKFTENYYAQLSKHARVENVTATVFADGFSADQAASLERSVTAALGVKAERGDLVAVDTTPWDRTMMEVPAPAPEGLLALDSADRAPWSNSTLLGLLLAQSLLIAGGIGSFLFFGRRRSTAPSLEETCISGLRPAGIVDHSQNKTGFAQVHPAARTGVHTTELLEGIVKERPTQVADLLRSTWLSAKD